MLRPGASGSRLRVLLLQPPSPPLMNVGREWAGGYGTAVRSDRIGYGSDPEYLAVPYMSLLFSASILERAGHEVDFVDAQIEALDDREVAQRVGELAPDLLVSVVNLPSLKGDLALLERVSSAAPQAKVVAVGTVCRGLPEEVLAGKAVAAVVEGDPEVVLPDLAQVLCEGRPVSAVPGLRLHAGEDTEATCVPATICDWASIPAPAYHLAPMHLYEHAFFGQRHRYAQVLTSRGCPFPCSYYCPYPFGFGSKTLLRRPSSVVDELAALRERHGVSFVIFRDQVLTLRRDHIEAALEGMLERRLGLDWICETRVDRVDQALLEKMRAAGCRQINYGLETCDQELFAARAKPGAAFADAEQALEWTRKAGIEAHLHLIVGFPGETWQSVRRTARVVAGLSVKEVGVAIMTPYPGTQLYSEALARGLILTQDWTEYTGFRPVMRTERLSAEDLVRAQSLILEAHGRRGRLRRAVRSRLGRAWRGITDCRRGSSERSGVLPSSSPTAPRGDWKS